VPVDGRARTRPPADFARLVHAEADGLADAATVAVLERFPSLWRTTLLRLLDDVDDALEAAERLPRPERDLVVADFEAEYDRLDAALTRLIGPAAPVDDGPAPADQAPRPATIQVQLSWTAGQVVAWAGSRDHDPEPASAVLERLARLNPPAPTGPWQLHDPVPIPGGRQAEAVAAPLLDVLGWLVALGAAGPSPDISPSAAWLGQVAVTAVRHVAQGRMVPSLQRARRARRRRGPDTVPNDDDTAYQVVWLPALPDPAQLDRLARGLPGAVTALGGAAEPAAVVTAALADIVTAICAKAATGRDFPAPPPRPRDRQEVAEAMLARLDGSTFDAPARYGAEIVRRLEQWARPATAPTRLRLLVQLDPPDRSDAWHLAVFAPGDRRELEPVETALVTASGSRRKEIQDHLTRLERLFPPLLRPGGHRRGEVVLSQDEAWQLMSQAGEGLVAAGYDVRVPALSRRRPTPALRLTSETGGERVVGAQQLANVRWSAVFDDVELTAEEISRLAAQARPMVRSRGQWVALDHADLAEAAAALADRAGKSRLTGAEMLRHALGLEGSPLAGGISLSGEGWAADLLRSAARVPADPPTRPEGFRGELRSYQAEALAWLRFLHGAELGGCLALDMGLGKTPTMLAHLATSRGEHPDLVIAPPAVVGNWAAESRRFTPGLRVVVHHGAARAEDEDLAAEAARADVLITTYGTAVRDIDALAALPWGTLVLDEAQVIKNPASETAQQLRRIGARSRLALTGTPIENGLGDLWAIMDFCNPGLVGTRASFVSQLSREGGVREGAESALRALNGILVFRRTKAEPAIAAELPDRIDEMDRCSMTPEQIGLYQAVLDQLIADTTATGDGSPRPKGRVLAAITALKQICNHPEAYRRTGQPLAGRSGKLARLEEIVEQVFASGERVLVFTHFAQWGEQLAAHLSARFGRPVACYHGGLARGVRDRMVAEFQALDGPGAMVLSLKAGGTGLNLTAASHVVLYDRWWNPAVEDQARDRVWRIGQKATVIAHRLVCPGTVDERVEEVVAGKRKVADLVLPKASSLDDLDADQLRSALGLKTEDLLVDDAPLPEAVAPAGARAVDEVA
jgi:superfamily II DNA or RNA helicase